MGTKEILEEAIKLKPQERLQLAEKLLHSLDEPHPTIEKIWIEEAQRRLRAYREGHLASVSFEDIFS